MPSSREETDISSNVIHLQRKISQQQQQQKQKIQVKTVKLNTYIEISMYLHQNTAHVWEGHSEPYYALLR